MNYEKSWTRPGNLREVKVQAKVHFSAPTKDGKNIFQVIDRRSPGVRSWALGDDQDKFSMVIVDKNGKLIKDLGSHPSLNGTKKFAKNRGFIK